MNEKEDEETPNVTDIAELQVSVQEVEFYLRNLDVIKACGRRKENQHVLSKNVVFVLHQVFANCF